MPRDRPKQAKRRLVQPIPRNRERKPIMHPQHMTRQRILSQLHDVIGSCEDLFAEHGETCECETCCVVSNFVGSLRLFHMLAEIS